MRFRRSLAAGGRGRKERQLAGKMGRPSGGVESRPAGGRVPGGRAEGSWSGRRGFEEALNRRLMKSQEM